MFVLNSVIVARFIIQYGAFSWLTLSMVVCVFIAFFLEHQIYLIIKEALSVSGLKGKGGVSLISKAIAKERVMELQMKRMLAAVATIGSEEFDALLSGIEDNQVVRTLQTAHSKMTELRKNENIERATTEGLATLVDMLHKSETPEDYCWRALSTIARFIGASHGALYRRRAYGTEEVFDLVAAFAHGEKKSVQTRISPGEGLIGQCFFEREVVQVSDLPPDYIKITSGLGSSVPACLCLIPLIHEGAVYGAVELASLAKLTPSCLPYLKKAAEVLAHGLAGFEHDSRNERLLVQSQTLTKELRQQEAQLRQHMQQLKQTQEVLTRNESEFHTVMSSLSVVQLDLDGHVIDANPVFLAMTGYSSSGIRGRRYRELIPAHTHEARQYDIMWQSILSGRTFCGEFRIVNSQQHELWTTGSLTPISDVSGNMYKIMGVFLFTTQDKEKLRETQETLSALRACFPIAELNDDLTFRSANNLFLAELGFKRLELANTSVRKVLMNGSFAEFERVIAGYQAGHAHKISLHIADKYGVIRNFRTTIVRINSQKKFLFVLQDAL